MREIQFEIFPHLQQRSTLINGYIIQVNGGRKDRLLFVLKSAAEINLDRE
jgi:hypothetical protein